MSKNHEGKGGQAQAEDGGQMEGGRREKVQSLGFESHEATIEIRHFSGLDR